MSRMRKVFIWATLAAVVVAPIALAATSPLLAWRDPIYIAAGFAGIVGMTVMLPQPLLAARYVPGLSASRAQLIHRIVGVILVISVVLHVAGLWITSPPDVIDALLFASPTPFSFWGVIAMWALFASAVLAALRRRLNVRWQSWRMAHMALAVVIVTGTVIHAVLIEGTMETISKLVLCACLIGATLKALSTLGMWRVFRKRS